MRILLVEDQPAAARMLAKSLREQAYAVDLAADSETALFQIGTTDYDAVVLDVELPTADGFTVCRTIRQKGCAVPILMVTACDSIDARIQGLDSGADDYLIKPFDFGELLARLRSVIRRGSKPMLPVQLVIDSLTLDTRSRQVWVDGRDAALTAKEYALLEHLMRHAGAVVSRSDIAEHVWDEHYNPMSNVVDVCVQRLRRKLARVGSRAVIRTRRGEGYQLAAGPNDHR